MTCSVLTRPRCSLSSRSFPSAFTPDRDSAICHDERLAELSTLLETSDEVIAVDGIVALLPDLHATWEYAVGHDRGMAVGLVADILTYAYTRGRPDLLAWGTVVAGWEIEHPRLPTALEAAAGAAWAGGRLSDAARIATRGVEVAAGSPEAAGPLMQLANLAMFEGRNDEAAAGYRRVTEILKTAGADVEAVGTEICEVQALAYSGRSQDAKSLMPDLVRRAEETGHPSTIAWAHYVQGETFFESDPAAGTSAYHQAVEATSSVNNRFFQSLSRSSLVALAAWHGSPGTALVEFEQVMDEWEDLGNEALHWMVLLPLAVLLTRAGSDDPAARLAGAVLATRDRHPMLPHHVRRLEDAVATMWERHPGTGEALTAGALLDFPGAVALAREAIRSTRNRTGAGAPGPRLTGHVQAR